MGKGWWAIATEKLDGLTPDEWLWREYPDRFNDDLAKELSELLGKRVTKIAIRRHADELIGLRKSKEFWKKHYDSMRAPRIILPRFLDYPKMRGKATVGGDFHIPFHDVDLVEKMVEVSIKMDSKQLIVAGDFFNFDLFSKFISEQPYLPGEEIDYGERLLDYLAGWYDKILILMGNHERRLYARKLDKIIDWERVSRMFTKHEGTIIFSKYAYCVLNNTWRITHPKNYRQIPTRVANELAIKYRQNILNFHGHALSITLDKSGHQVIADGGGLFDESKIEYRMIEDSTYPAWNKGFWVITEDNEIHGFNDKWCPWEFYEKAWAKD